MFDATFVLMVAISFVFAVILAVFEAILFVNTNSAAVALVTSAAIADVFAVILAVFEATLFVSINSAALAVVASVLIALVTSAVFAFKLMRFDKLVVSNVLAANCVGVTYIVLSEIEILVANCVLKKFESIV